MNEMGIISEVKNDRARVAIGSMVTDFLPVMQPFSNSFAVAFSPIRVGEQVVVLPIRGALNSGVILRGFFQNAHKMEPNDKEVSVVFEDGVKISYSTASKTLSIQSPTNINLVADVNIAGNLNVSKEISDKKGN